MAVRPIDANAMLHSNEGFERTPAWTELVPVLVVRVPVMSAEQKAGLRAEIASSSWTVCSCWRTG